MFALTPIMYKYIGLALFLAGFGLYCHHLGYAGEHDKFVTYQAQVTQAAKDQNEASQRKDKANEEQTLAVANIYSGELDRLRSKLNSLQHNANGFGKLPQATDSTKGTNGEVKEPSGIRGCDEQFYSNALEDALKLQAWQDWATRLNLPQE